MNGPIVLDISRLLSRADRRVPTGIDRVEHAYATTLRQLAPDRLRYAAVHPLGRFGHLPTAEARTFVEQMGRMWEDAMPGGPAAAPSTEDVRRMARRLHAGMMLPQRAPRFLQHGAPRPSYLLVSHHHLHKPDLIRTAKRRLGAAFVCFIQDLIPIEFPEFGRPLGAEKHTRRIETAVGEADALLVATEAVGEALRPFLQRAGRDVPVRVMPLGVHVGARAPGQEPVGPPYFLYVGTIEPRKNHLLLFNVWRRLAEQMGPAAPRLVLVGHRGWENEMVLDVLERSRLRDLITEHESLPDSRVRELVAGARAVLLPSFAEGYGLPVAEALAAGTPVLCSDLPAMREVGGEAAEFLDPLDGLGWLRAVRDYAEPGSPRRAAQVARIAAWSPPAWDSHVRGVVRVIDGLA